MSLISKSKSSIQRNFLVATSVISGLLLTSCMDDFDSQELPPAAYVSIFQGATDAPAMDIYANQNRVNQEPLQYAQILPYSPFYPGTRDFRFSASNSATSLLEKDLVLAADSVYSIFVANEVDGIDAILTTDVWEDPTAEKAQLRFVHLAADAANLYLEVSDSKVRIAEGAMFKSVSEFIEVEPGNVKLAVKSTETGEMLIQSGTLELKGNRVYTLVLRGMQAEATGAKKLDIQLVTNYINY